MSLRDDISAEVDEIFRSQWTVRDGRVVPEPETLNLGNDAVRLDGATILYADLAGSTNLVDTFDWRFAAEIYKAFLVSAARVIRSEGGQITAYDGDRIMAVFVGDLMCTSAVRTALKINYCREEVINPLISTRYPDKQFRPKHVVGIDCSEIRAARIGVRKANDLVWVGRAANYAAKLTELPSDYPSRITKTVYGRLPADLKVSDGKQMWEPVTWKAMNDLPIYRSTYRWRVD